VLGSKRASAGILSLKIGPTAESESAGGYESNKFSCHCFVCFLFFSAIKAPLSRMDDRNGGVAVTNFLRKFFRAPRNDIYSVTLDRAALSSSAVWTCFALHG
jgi:hypothetical protein